MNSKNGKWNRREKQRSKYAVGRIGIVSPKDSERFHLKLILNRITGAKSFKDLRTYNGKVYETYKEAAHAIGLIENDSNVIAAFEEACSIMLPKQLRTYFANFLLLENIPGNVTWEKYKEYFLEDFKIEKENNALHIESFLKKENITCKDLALPIPKINSNDCDDDLDESYI